MWKIGNIEIEGKIVMAPMAGISNTAYMQICEKMGVNYVITELISAEAIVRDNKKTLEMLNGIDELKIPYAIQLFGANANVLSRAAQIVHKLYPKAIIDINMGCPVPKVAVRASAGSALLKDTNKIYEIVKEVSKSVDAPVTVKIRSGWDKDNINAVEVAKICEKAGAKAITIHARTRSQGYTGKSDWSIIKDVVDSVSIPVIGNGDITTPELAEKMLKDTGCTAIMIGRGLLGNPWLIKQTQEYITQKHIVTTVTYKDRIDMIKKHYELLCKYKNEKVALLEIRSNALWYLKGMPNNNEIKNKICGCKDSNELFDILENYSTCL